MNRSLKRRAMSINGLYWMKGRLWASVIPLALPVIQREYYINHRATILHAYALIAPDAMNLSNRDCILPVVPLFHVNSWGSPYGAMMVGSKIVYPGPKMADGETLYNLMEEEKVTVSLGVPTVWMVLLQYAAKHNKKLNSLQRTIIGGAAVPESMIRDFQDNHDVFVQQAWGMTEMTPLGTVMSLKHGMEDLTNDELVRPSD